MAPVARWLIATARFWYNFIRLPLLGFTLTLPLVGAVVSGAHPTPTQAAGLLMAGLAFHCFAYVLNDVVDLPIDRSESLRADFPLVRGEIGPRTALAFALAQFPLALALTALLGGSALAYAALSIAYGLIAVYDLWGKHTPLPPLIDLMQGLGWAAMVSYGAAIMGDALTPGAVACAAFVVLYITLLNGVHGGLRDLENDLGCGAHTTAIMLGARPDGRGGATITPRLAGYTLAVQFLICAVLLGPLYANWYGYSPVAWPITSAAVTLLIAAALVLLAVLPRLMGDRWAMIYAGSWHLLLLLTGMVAIAAPLARPWLLAIIVVAHILPLLVNFWLYRSLVRWARSVLGLKGSWHRGDEEDTAPYGRGADHAD